MRGAGVRAVGIVDRSHGVAVAIGLTSTSQSATTPPPTRSGTPPALTPSQLSSPALGLGAIPLRQPMRDLYDAKVAGGGANSHDETRHTDWRCLDLAHANHATPKVLTQMLELIWTDQAASPTRSLTQRLASAA